MRYAYGDKSWPHDENGYLEHFESWDEDLAAVIAAAEDIILTPEHWEVLYFLRQYYADFEIAPAIRVLTKAVARRLGPEKGNEAHLRRLFPGGPAKQACKIAGLPRPTGCV
ncbi:TusE/DsrC/DsvC family sulfur relay protein [Telmatospirillum sp. J64-1]|uniref:TusE/DsrC/DsvC family sulfur relay protein n=1 Tax=Telmatospirillum sp. J64-1 TaxID=2502183 RepID=UPI001C8F2A12|nr:TusE/DsrC/DsvC family sulfur relay protein [Telmatospirillum sp. J64-1]